MKPHLIPAGTSMHFHWNIDCAVGKGGANSNIEDISYIQWYYTLAARSGVIDPARAAIYSRVKVTGTCRGTDDDPLVAAITAHQKFLQHPIVDGRISVAHGSNKVGTKAFFIFRLGARLADMFPREWPRLDLIERCPEIVKAAVRQTVPRVPAAAD